MFLPFRTYSLTVTFHLETILKVPLQGYLSYLCLPEAFTYIGHRITSGTDAKDDFLAP
jgi:hypothetical protein